MFFKQKAILVSVCIPVYNSEPFLQSCLESVSGQDFQFMEQIEIIVVNDGSNFSGSPDAKKIVKDFSKKEKRFKTHYFEHYQNNGLVEARRTALYNAKGDFILNLDSDDQLEPNAIRLLYEKAISTDSDIVQCGATSFFSTLHEESDSLKNYKESRENMINKFNPVVLTGNEIFNDFLVYKNHSWLVWGKLFKKETCLNAFEHISPIYCTMAEDFIQYFWISHEAKKYSSIPEKLFRYSIDTGVSSGNKIENLEQWKKVCSTASVFTAIYTEINEKQVELTQEQLQSLAAVCKSYLANNLAQLNNAVSTEIKSQARALLGEFWGEDFVSKIEKQIQG